MFLFHKISNFLNIFILHGFIYIYIYIYLRRKSTVKAKWKAINQQERIHLGKQHFENLLGNPPKVTHEPITRIISKQLGIKLGPFTQEELDSVLRKIRNRKAVGLDEILTICRILVGVRAKKPTGNHNICRLYQGLWIHSQRKDGAILLTYDLPKETVVAIMILYRITKVKVCSPDGDTNYFDIVAGVLQGDTLAQYLFIICLDYVLRTSIDKIKENGFKLTKERSRRYPEKTITNTDYTDDIALLANTPIQA